MANLETLELTISANAQSASDGLKNLISSLTSLAEKVESSVSWLQKLNSELATLKGNTDFRMPSFASNKTLNGVKSVTNAVKNQKKAVEDLSDYDWGNRKAVANGFKGGENAKPEDVYQAEYKAMQEAEKARRAAIHEQATRARLQRQIAENPVVKYLNTAPQASQYPKQYIEQSQRIGAAFKSAAESASVFKEQMADVEEQTKESVPFTERAKTAWGNFKEGAKNLGHELKGLIPKFSMLHKVMRIASTMMIRMGIRALFKGIKEGFDNYYQYSKATGGVFAKEMDGLSSAWAQLKNQMGAAISPAIGAVIPILNSITSAALTAFNALSQLFALLGGKNSWSKATAQITAFDSAAKKAGGGGGGANELLAKFDELNLIANEGGGGGGGGAAGEEFATMFEEMYDFDSKIRSLANFIKETVDWVKDNFDTLLITAGLIGTAILGWKMSKAFEGAIATLGKLIMGGAMIAIGVVLDFDFGKKLGSSLAGGDSLSGLDIVEGIAGVIAAAIGGYVIGHKFGHGGAGVAIGITFSVVATLAGMYVGAVDQLDKMKWGNVSLTPEQVKQYVQSQFTFPVEAEIQLINDELKVSRSTRAHLEGMIQEFSRSLNRIKIGVDTSPESLAEAIKKADSIVEAIKDHFKANTNLVDVLLTNLNYGDTVKTGVLTDISTANNKMLTYIESKGKEIADAYDRGMSNGWKANESQEIMDLLTHLENIYKAGEESKALNELIVNSKFKLSKATRETAQAVLQAQKEEFDAYKTTVGDAIHEAALSLYQQAAMASEMGLADVAEQLKADADHLIETYDEQVELKLSESKGAMKQTWIDTLNDIYSTDYSKLLSQQKARFDRDLKDAFIKRGSYTEAQNVIKKYLEEVVNINPVTKGASELFGITGWELLSNDLKTKFFNNVWKALGVDGVKLLKDTLNINASSLINISGWDSFAALEKFYFVNALVSAFGASEALSAAKNAGINVAQMLKDGLASGDKGIRDQAIRLKKAITEELANLGIKIPIDAEIDVIVDAVVNVTPNVVGGSASSVDTSITGNKASATLALARFATGGFPDQGSVFIAGEKGAELVGSINGKTGVANNDQIVEGIRRGVSDAQSEQNSLLRQQNALLQSILEKDSSVRIGASAALGRVARQSLDMYSSMVGG